MLGSVGRNGYSWASSTRNTNSNHLDFYMTHLNPTSANHRGYGFQLRCLSE
ncbi:hypothetical protein [uncultured Rikenella sp.]|uniref:hypothetical protein n=1 Tax=uncultured Rikenella sp. TaxID=368003 RepID=UPI0026238F0F|nr:hypothetical protein [uncultured Rikenella sp.]